jgi:hypothetical protein
MSSPDEIRQELRRITHIVDYGCDSRHCPFGEWRDVQRTQEPCECAAEIKRRLTELVKEV